MISLILATNAIPAVAHRIDVSWTWYVIRAAGFVAAGLLALLVITGIGQVTGLLYRFIEPIKAWALHRALAFALCASIAVHVIFLLLDKFLPFSLAQVLIPFVSHYSNGSTLLGISTAVLGVACGIVAMYGIALLVLSSLGWIDSKKRLWRRLHYLSYVVALCVFMHALSVGSDLKYGAFRELWIALSLVVLIGIIARVCGVLARSRKIPRKIDNYAGYPCARCSASKTAATSGLRGVIIDR